MIQIQAVYSLKKKHHRVRMLACRKLTKFGTRKQTNCYFLHCTCVVIFIVFNFIFARTYAPTLVCTCVCAITRNLFEYSVNSTVNIFWLRCSFLNEAIINSLTKLQLERTTQRPKTRAFNINSIDFVGGAIRCAIGY